jgi:hypothetical protein
MVSFLLGWCLQKDLSLLLFLRHLAKITDGALGEVMDDEAALRPWMAHGRVNPMRNKCFWVSGA